jgi:AraC family transcriptional activator FtrA
MPEKSDKHLVCALAYDGLCTFEFGIAVEAFALQRPELPISWYDFQVISADPSPIAATGGITLQVDGGLNLLEKAHTLIIPGWKGPDIPVHDDLCDAIIKAHKRGCRIITICSGVFVLAATGLLDGKPATTHWRYCPRLADNFPAINVQPDVLYVEAGDNIFTSAGSAAGLDLCLHIIQLDHGPDIANKVAKRFVLPTYRQGGQAQFIEKPPARDNSNLAPLLDTLRASLNKTYSVPEIAAMAHMSPRTLIRHFKKTTGLTPQNWLTSERINRATELLETSRANIDSVGLACGFNTPETFRHHFRRKIGTSPSQYRKSFNQPIATK